jgi:hypothetical protein
MEFKPSSHLLNSLLYYDDRKAMLYFIKLTNWLSSMISM